MNNLRSLITLFYLAFSLQSHAQGDRKQQCKITILAWDQKAQQISPSLWSDNSELVKNLSISSLRRSQIIKYKGNGMLTITRNATAPPPGTEEYKLSTITINPKWKRCLVIIRTDSKSKTGFRLTAIDDSLSDFKWGSYRFINNTGILLGFQLDKNKVVLKKSKFTYKTFSPNWNQKNFASAVWVKGRKKPAYTSIWEHHPDKRSLVIIEKSKDKRLGLIKIKVIEERKPTSPVNKTSTR